MKKLTCIIIVLALALAFCGCGKKNGGLFGQTSGDAQQTTAAGYDDWDFGISTYAPYDPRSTPEATEAWGYSISTIAPYKTTEPAAGSGIDVYGTISGSRYENEFLGIGFDYDNSWYDNWKHYSKEEIARIYDQTLTLLSDDIEEELRTDADQIVILLGEFEDGIASLNICLTRNSSFSYIDENTFAYFLDSFIEPMKEQLEHVGYEDVSVFKSSAFFLGEDKPCLEMTGSISGLTINQKELFMLKDNYLVTIAVKSFMDMEDVDDLIESFYKLDDKTSSSGGSSGISGISGTGSRYVCSMDSISFTIPSGWDISRESSDGTIFENSSNLAIICVECKDLAATTGKSRGELNMDKLGYTVSSFERIAGGEVITGGEMPNCPYTCYYVLADMPDDGYVILHAYVIENGYSVHFYSFSEAGDEPGIESCWNVISEMTAALNIP